MRAKNPTPPEKNPVPTYGDKHIALCFSLPWPCMAFFLVIYGLLWPLWPFMAVLWSFMAKYWFDLICFVFFRGHRSKLIWSCFFLVFSPIFGFLYLKRYSIKLIGLRFENFIETLNGPWGLWDALIKYLQDVEYLQDVKFLHTHCIKMAFNPEKM